MSTSYSWEGKGRYGSFRLRMNMCPLRTRATPERFYAILDPFSVRARYVYYPIQ